MIRGTTFRAAAAALLFAAPARAADRLDLEYAKGWVSDIKLLGTAPARWQRAQWIELGAVAGVTAAVYGFDRRIQSGVQEHRTASCDRAARPAEHFGNGMYLTPGLGAAYVTGALADSPRARRVGLYGFEGFILSGAITNALKSMGRRHRPYTGDPYDTWDGPGLSGSADNRSFPSGHSTSAFAVMTVVATEYADTGWVPPVAYGLASATAVSRVYQNKHWASDIVFGSAIGYFTSKAIVGYHAREPGRLSYVPELQAGPDALRAVWRF